MIKHFALAVALLAAPAAAPVAAQSVPAVPPSPGEIVAGAAASEWVAITPDDLLVMDLAPDAKGNARRVVIQLLPKPFSQPWIANIRNLAKAHWWDGLAIVRAQDNYVVQWGDPDGEEAAKARALPEGMQATNADGYVAAAKDFGTQFAWTNAGRVPLGETYSPIRTAIPDAPGFKIADPYAGAFSFVGGFPVALGLDGTTAMRRVPHGPDVAWPIHCYGAVGVGRNLSPDAGSGAELYTVIGHGPRHLDRNIAVVGRVIEGIEHQSTLPRGTAALGFYETPAERTQIASIRMGSDVPGLPTYQYLSAEGETFARYAEARANRRDPFFNVPAGGADICNIPVPVRRQPPEAK